MNNLETTEQRSNERVIEVQSHPVMQHIVDVDSNSGLPNSKEFY